MKNKKYLFGPILSRRLGVSLGIDIVPFKTCTFDCIYCECGKTTLKTSRIKKYANLKKILKELNEFLKTNPSPDYITITGSGEPTLNSQIGKLIKYIKKYTNIPVAVLTNGSLFYKKSVRKKLSHADLVIPSLDAGSEETFFKINRPTKKLNFQRIVNGLITFTKEFKGKVWLEVFILKGINDNKNEILKMIKIIKQISPDKIQLNSIDRPPAENFAKAMNYKELEKILKIFIKHHLPAEIIKKTKKNKKKIKTKSQKELEIELLNLLKRRPETLSNLAKVFDVSINNIIKTLKKLEDDKKIIQIHIKNSKQPHYKAKSI